MPTAKELIEFEDEVAARFESKEIRGPIHLNSPTQAAPLIEIYRKIKPEHWVLSTWRSHWHALLKGVPRERVMKEILRGKSMQLHFQDFRFMSSAIVGGMLPIGCGLAAAGHRVWCFVGDMCASGGAFYEATKLANGYNLPITFIVENNGLSTNTPTETVWGKRRMVQDVRTYKYVRSTQHCGTDNYVSF